MVAKADQWDRFRLQEAISQLTSLSLITYSIQQGFLGLSMHPLTNVWAKDHQNPLQQRRAWTTVGSVLALSHWGSQMWRTYERQLRPHIQSYLEAEVQRMVSYGPLLMIL
jgi:hypothetical protein